MDSRCCHPTLIMIFALISNGLLSAHQAFSTLEEVISVNKLLNNCYYFVAFTDDLETDGYFFADIPRTYYVRSDASITEFASFIDQYIVHYRGDITRESILDFAKRHGIERCQNPFLESREQLDSFSRLPVVLVENAAEYHELRHLLDDQIYVGFATRGVLGDMLDVGLLVDEFNQEDAYPMLVKCDYRYFTVRTGDSIYIGPVVDKTLLHMKVNDVCAVGRYVRPRDVVPQTEDSSYFYWREFQRRYEVGLAPQNRSEPVEEYVKPRESRFISEPAGRRMSDAERAAFRDQLVRKYGNNRQVADELVFPNDVRYRRAAAPDDVEDSDYLMDDAL